ncbi:single-stranded DNA-binding protein [Candidatus Saccharibacteria bacterium]|nr:single-stranded DNA-binding protein [Candidatus Saccharibacteria bacterium]
MARSINKATILGNLTRDPEMRYTPDGQSVTTFGVATNRRWTNKDGQQQEDTEFHNVVAWGKLAEICTQLLKKGSQVHLEGRLQTRSWEGKDGVTRQRTEIVAEDMILLSRGKVEGEDANAAATGEEEVIIEEEPKAKKPAGGVKSKPRNKEKNAEEISEDEIPF